MHFVALRKAQETLLHANDRWAERLFWNEARYMLVGSDGRSESDRSMLGEPLQKFVEDSRLMAREILLGRDPGSIALPPLPTVSGEGKRFREGMRNVVHAYVDANPFLFPLIVPTRLTVFVVQPEQPRDLDNILLDLLPVVDEIMKPPQEPWLRSAVDALEEIPDDDPSAESQRRGLQRLRSVVEHGVWSCQVLELKKLADDPPEGALGMILGHGENMRSLWTEATSRLQAWEERDRTGDW